MYAQISVEGVCFAVGSSEFEGSLYIAVSQERPLEWYLNRFYDRETEEWGEPLPLPEPTPPEPSKEELLLSEVITSLSFSTTLQAKQEAAKLGADVSYSPEETEAVAIAAKLPPIADGHEWRAGLWLANGTIVTHNAKNYLVLQGHLAQSDWLPEIVPALFKELREDNAPWVQPLGAHDVYMLGDKVTHAVYLWSSTVDYNAWEPGVHGWEKLTTTDTEELETEEPQSPAIEAWQQRHSAPYYQVGDRVTHKGKTWECTAGDGSGNNSWEPGVYGWTEVIQLLDVINSKLGRWLMLIPFILALAA